MLNKVNLIGRLGADPEIRFTQNQKQVANITLATSEQWTDRQTGQKQEKTEWHKLVIFDRLAEIAGEYLSKGSMIYIEGKLQTRKWQNKDGVDQYTTEVVVNELKMLGGNQQAKAPDQQAQPQPAYQQPQAQPQPAYQQPQAQPQAAYQQPEPQPNEIILF